jgi:hypothetical protein
MVAKWSWEDAFIFFQSPIFNHPVAACFLRGPVSATIGSSTAGLTLA